MSNNFFGGAPALSWSVPNPDPNSPQRWLDNEPLRGVPLGGRVIAVGEPQQQTEMGTGKPRWWQEPNPATGVQGRPKMHIAITLRCDGTCGGRDLRNPENPTDTGDRVLYVPDFGDLNKAIKAAFTLAGDDDLRVGGVLLVAWLGYRPAKQANAHPARTFVAKYERAPSGLATNQAGGATSGATGPGPAGNAPPASPPPTQPAPVAGNPFGGPSQVQQQQQSAPAVAGTAPNPFA